MTDDRSNDDEIGQKEAEISLPKRIEMATAHAALLSELLPLFKNIIKLLEKGSFISSSVQIKEYVELSRFEDAYRPLLSMMGHELVFHSAGFYYLNQQEMSALTRREKETAAAIFCLIESLSDRGLPIETMISSEDPVTLNDIELTVEQHRQRLSKLDMGSVENFIATGMRKLIDTGVMLEIKRQDKTEYCFGIPAFFYLDICRKVAKDQERSQAQDAEDHDGLDRDESIPFADLSSFDEQAGASIDDLASAFLDTNTDNATESGQE